MSNTITMTSKGTFTMPIYIRKQLNVSSKGDKLAISYDPKTKKVTISSPVSIEHVNEELAPYIAGKKPLEDAGAYYAKRKPKA